MINKNEAATHGGGRARCFTWWLTGYGIEIETERSIHHSFDFSEIHSVLADLHNHFGKGWFPLANNVEKLYNGTEARGLGSTIYDIVPGNTRHAQGSSYLGVILEQAGILEWNGKARGIRWRFVGFPENVSKLKEMLSSVS